MKQHRQAIQRFITAGILGSLFWAVFFYMPVIAFSVLLGIIITIILIKEWGKFFRLNHFWFWFIMPWYPILPFVLMIYLNHNTCYRLLLYYTFVIVFSFDSAAYVVGKLIGHYKITPIISPGKTLEGCIGGILFTFGAFEFALYNANVVMPWPTKTLLIMVGCMLAFLGDIFESFLKRKAHLKDSGDLLPGHGGFLDRFDAVMMVSYFVFLFRHELAQAICPL